MLNVKDVKLGKNTRKSFAKIDEVLEMPNLIEVQKNSYKWFLDEGLREVFRDVATITDYNGNLELNFVDYRIDEKPKYTVAECKDRDVNQWVEEILYEGEISEVASDLFTEYGLGNEGVDYYKWVDEFIENTQISYHIISQDD